MRFFRLPFFLLTITLLVISIASCKEEKTIYDKEKIFIDSIEQQLTTIEIALESINASELQKRIALVNTWYVNLKDTSYDVAQKLQADYNGFKVVYKKFIDSFFVYKTELELLKEQVNELKNKINKQKITKEEFKKNYAVLKASTANLRKKTYAITKPVNDLAFSWRRYYKQN